jgi:hypothetical protein
VERADVIGVLGTDVVDGVSPADEDDGANVDEVLGAGDRAGDEVHAASKATARPATAAPAQMARTTNPPSRRSS